MMMDKRIIESSRRALHLPLSLFSSRDYYIIFSGSVPYLTPFHSSGKSPNLLKRRDDDRIVV